MEAKTSQVIASTSWINE